jgi:hypothetical protein
MFTKILSYQKERYIRWLAGSLLFVNVSSLMATILFISGVLKKPEMLGPVAMMCLAMFLVINAAVILDFLSETRDFRDALYFRIDASESKIIATIERYLENNRFTCSIERKNGTKAYWVSDPDSIIRIKPGMRSIAVIIGAVTPDNERRLRKLLGELRESMRPLTKVWQDWTKPAPTFRSKLSPNNGANTAKNERTGDRNENGMKKRYEKGKGLKKENKRKK